MKLSAMPCWEHFIPFALRAAKPLCGVLAILSAIGLTKQKKKKKKKPNMDTTVVTV